MTTADYRSKARAVRAAAQGKLLEFRRARRAAARRGGLEAEAEAEADLQDIAGPVEAETLDLEGPARSDAHQPFEPQPESEPEPAPAAAAPAAEKPADAWPDMAISARAARYASAVRSAEAATPPMLRAAPEKRAAMKKAEATPQEAVRAARPSRRAAAAPAAEPAAPEVAASDDLASLTGLGPGLVWLLRKAGVETRSDLIAAEPEGLAQRLGLVGRLVDVAALQALASGGRER